MYRGVPTLENASIVWLVKSLPRPRSPSFKSPFPSMKIFAGFRSLCMTLIFRQCSNALAICWTYAHIFRSGISSFLSLVPLINYFKSPLSAHSTAMNISLSYMKLSLYLVICSCCSFSISFTSLIQLSRCFMSAMSKILSNLSAINCPVTLLSALKTKENLPWPMGYIIS